MNPSRRDFVKNLGAVSIGAALFSFLKLPLGLAAPAKKEASKPAAEVPLPAGQKAILETDPVATALGYRADIEATLKDPEASKDPKKAAYIKKYAQRKKPEAKTQFCNNCSFYTSQNEGWGKCTMLSAGLVAAKGWCASYQKKA